MDTRTNQTMSNDEKNQSSSEEQKELEGLPTLEEMRAREKKILEIYERAEEEFGAV